MALSCLWRRGPRPQAYQRGILRRYQREGSGWAAHLEATRQALLEFAQRAGARELSVLGSGCLLDVPVDELLELGITLHLYDVAHPPQVLTQYAGYSRVRFHTADVTGGLLNVLGLRRGRRMNVLRTLQNLTPQNSGIPQLRPTVSLNLLSQLGYPLQEAGWLRLSEPEYAELVARMQCAHLEWLSCCPAALLVSDVRELHFSLRDGEFLGTVSTVLAKLPMLDRKAEWRWAFDTVGAYLPDCKVELEVVCGQLGRN